MITHTLTYAYTRTHTHTHILSQTLSFIYTSSLTHLNSHTHSNTHILLHTHSHNPYPHSPTLIHTHAHMHKLIHTLTQRLMHIATPYLTAKNQRQDWKQPEGKRGIYIRKTSYFSSEIMEVRNNGVMF